MSSTSVVVLSASASGEHKQAAKAVASALSKSEFGVAAIRGELPDACLFFEKPLLIAGEDHNRISSKQILTWLWDHRHLRCMRRESLVLWGGPDPESGRLTVGVGTSLEGDPRVAVRAAKMYGERAVFL